MKGRQLTYDRPRRNRARPGGRVKAVISDFVSPFVAGIGDNSNSPCEATRRWR